MPFVPVALFGLEVPAGDIMVPVTQNGRVNVSTSATRLSMARRLLALQNMLLRIDYRALWLTADRLRST